MIISCLSLPSVFYAMSDTLPQQNTLTDSKGVLWIAHHSAPFAMLGVDMMVTPWACTRFAAISGLRRSKLLMTARMFTMWLVAAVTTVMLHENCYAGWKWFWSVCHDETRLLDYRLHWDNIEILNPTRDLCSARPAWWRQGRCSRALVETVTPLFLRKLILRACVQPLVSILMWRVSERTSAGRLQFRGFPTDGSLNTDEQHAMLVTLGEMALLWGPLIPLVLPLVSMALSTNLLTFNIAVTRFQVVPHHSDTSRISLAYLRFTLGVCILFMVWFASETGMHGRSLVLCFAAALAVRAGYRIAGPSADGDLDTGTWAEAPGDLDTIELAGTKPCRCG